MGFGHRVYKTDDPRSVFLRGVAERIGAEKIEFAKVVEQTVVDVLAELKPGRNLYANVEFYAGVVMDHCGLPRELFTPDVRVEPGHRLVRQHPRAGRRQPHHPPVGPLRRPAPAPARPRRVVSVGGPWPPPSASPPPATPRSSPPRSSASCPSSPVEPAAAARAGGGDAGVAGHQPVRGPRRRRHDRRRVHPGRVPDPHRPAGVDRGRHHRRGRPRPGRRRGPHPGDAATGPASSAASPSTSPAAPAARPPTASTSGSASSSARPTSTGST